ncbi:MAG: hypothetical protein AB1746_09090 [Candidatus Zixiibacteriota bacterium]
MRKFRRLLLIPTVLFGLALLAVMPGITLAGTDADVGFADFDGDGINDNAPDDDGDGIPNDADPDYMKDTGGQSGFINFSASLKATAIDDALLTNYDKFGKKRFSARALTENRCGFTSDEGFGSDIGIGIGAAGGGACAGGVCR